MSKLSSFFRSFFRNLKADPVSSLKGAVSLTAAGATAYGMATGKVPVNELSLGAASAMATSGLHALGSNSTGTGSAVVAAVAADIVPQVATVASHYEEIRKEAGKAQATLAAIAEGIAVLEQLKGKPAAGDTQ